MPKCTDCGFAEENRSSRRDPATGKFVNGPILTSIECHSNPKTKKIIRNPYDERKCKDFVCKIPNFSIKDYHTLKANAVANKRNFRIHIVLTGFAIVISLLTLFFGYIIPFLTPPPPEVDLGFQFFPEKMVAPVDHTIPASFILYNKGSKICFIQTASIYELFENRSLQPLSDIYDAKKTSIAPGEIKEYNFEIFNSSGENITKEYQIFVFYEPDNYITSPTINVEWFKYPT